MRSPSQESSEIYINLSKGEDDSLCYICECFSYYLLFYNSDSDSSLLPLDIIYKIIINIRNKSEVNNVIKVVFIS